MRSYQKSPSHESHEQSKAKAVPSMATHTISYILFCQESNSILCMLLLKHHSLSVL